MTRRRTLSVLLALACASACSVQVTGAKKPAPTASRVAVAATGAPSTHSETSAAPSGAVPTGAASVTPLPPNLLQPLAGGAVGLVGKVKSDASYLVAQKAGQLVSDQGGELVVAGADLLSDHGGGIISDHGAGVISNNSGNIIVAPGGNVISDEANSLLSDQGGGLLSDAGGGIIANNGAGIIANNGGGIVSNNSGNLISNNSGNLVGKVKRQLLADTGVSYGAQLPAVGMRVVVVSGATGKLLPIGKSKSGKLAYAVYTDIAGNYTIYPAPEGDDWVRVVTFVPDQTDARMGYNVFAKPGSSAPEIDEDTATATQYVRLGLRGKLSNLLALDDTVANGALPPDSLVDKFFGQSRAPSALRDPLKLIFSQIFAEMKKNPRITSADYGPLAQELGDMLVAKMGDLDAIDLQPDYFGNATSQANIAGKKYTTGKALPNLRAVLQEFRQAVIAKAASQDAAEAYFKDKPYIQSANLFHQRLNARDPVPYYRIRKPADLADFLAREYFSLVPDASYGCSGADCPATDSADCSITNGCIPSAGVKALNNAQIFELPKLVMDDLGLPEYYVSVINAVGSALAFNVGAQLANQDVLDAVLKRIDAYGAPATSSSGG